MQQNAACASRDRCSLWDVLGAHEHDWDERADHHAFDTRSVLGTVQGSPLPSDRASARPSGLDGACAQMIGRHLRDGHHMLFPSGTSGALIHPSNGREKRSHMFDRFRTHAFHPLVEVHFSRFCPLTIVARGASLFAFDGCCDAPPSAFGHRRGAAVDRRPQDRDQPRPSTREIGNDRRLSPASRKNASIEACGQKSPTLTRHAGVREDSTPSAECRLNDASTRTGHRSLRVTVGLSPSVPDVGLRPSSPRFCPRRAASGRAPRAQLLNTQFKRARRHACTRREVAMMKIWFNVSEAADYAGVSRDTIYTACERHELRSARLSGRRAIRIRPQWIDAWLEQHAAGGAQRSSGNTPSGAVS
jgi:excisionase family DNA binding protein